MKGHEIAENLRNSKHRFTTGSLHKVVDGEDAFCVMGLKAYEAGVSLRRLDETWNCSHIENAVMIYQINDNAANGAISASRYFDYNEIERENIRKQAVVKAFDSPKWRDFDFPVEAFIEYLRNTTTATA